MYQATIGQVQTTPALQRARGRAFVSVALARGASRLTDLAQSGSARVMLPRVGGPDPEAVFLNTSGGLTSGDALAFAMEVGGGARLTATTQTAERAYLARDGAARLTVSAQVGEGARLTWLPQETILFEGADLARETAIDLAPAAVCLLVETVVLGRRAMGETVTAARLRDRRRVTLAGKPLHVEALDLSPGAFPRLAGPAVLGPAHVFASLAMCGAGAEAAAGALRDLPAPDGGLAAVSGWNGRTLVRATATDLWPLKQYLGRVIARLTGQPLPRVWQMNGVSA
jgi:urease accessory protein